MNDVSLILLGQYFGAPVIVWWWHMDFIKLSDGWGSQKRISFHDMGCLLNDIFMIGSMGKVMMSFSGYFCCSTLMISIVMKYNSFRYLCWYHLENGTQ